MVIGLSENLLLNEQIDNLTGDSNESGKCYIDFLIECESIEIFADNQVYIAVYEGGAPSSSEFVISDEGKISFNETYNGTKALFEIPLDKSKANKDAVNSLLVELGFDGKDVIYSSQNIVEDENQHYEYEVPEDISINIDAYDDDGTYEYIIE